MMQFNQKITPTLSAILEKLRSLFHSGDLFLPCSFSRLLSRSLFHCQSKE